MSARSIDFQRYVSPSAIKKGGWRSSVRAAAPRAQRACLAKTPCSYWVKACHGAVGRLGDLRRQPVLAGKRLGLAHHLLDALRRLDFGRVLLEARRLVHVFAALGHGADDGAVDAVDVLAHLAERRAAFAAVDGG